MPRQKDVPIGDRKVVVRELTLEELRSWMEATVARKSLSPIDLMFLDDGLMVEDIPDFTDLSTADLGKLAPSDLEEVVKEIREVNGRFFSNLSRVMAPAQAPGSVSMPLSPASVD